MASPSNVLAWALCLYGVCCADPMQLQVPVLHLESQGLLPLPLILGPPLQHPACQIIPCYMPYFQTVRRGNQASGQAGQKPEICHSSFGVLF